MNFTLGVVGAEAEPEFARAMDITRATMQFSDPLQVAKTMNGQAIFGLTQPPGFFPLEKPFYESPKHQLCMLNGYLWYQGPFPVTEETAIQQISGAATELSRFGRLTLGAEDGGVFNFCVYDELQESLFISNDYSGIYPLYYAVSEKRLVFSNHIRLLARILGREWDPIGVIQRTAFHYTIGKRTLFNGIDRLRPGESLSYRVGASEVTVKHPEGVYSALDIYKDDWEAADAIFADYTAGIRELSKPAGSRGILLSGGYDSRLVAAGFREQGCSLSAVTIGEENNSEVKLALRVAKDLGIDIHVSNPVVDCQLTQKSVAELINGPETVNYTHFYGPGIYLKQKGAISASTGYGGDTLLGGNGYALFGNSYSEKNRFFLGLSRSFGFPARFSADFSSFNSDQINQAIRTYLDQYLKRSQRWFAPEWLERYQTTMFEQTYADVATEITRYLATSPESPLQVLERFWREHQELYTSDILTTLNDSLPLCLPTMHHAFVKRCSNLAPQMKVDYGVYRKIVRRYLGESGKIPTGSTPLPGNDPEFLLLMSRAARELEDRWKTKQQIRSKGQSTRLRYGWTNFESWFRTGDFLANSPGYIDASIFSRENLDLKIRRWINWDEKLYSGQELLTLITISQLIQ